MNMKTKSVLSLAAVLIPIFILTARYRSASDSLPADFRDAPGSERTAADELTAIAPGGGDLKLEMPVAEPQDAQTPEAGAAGQGAQRIFSENDPFHRRLAEALGMNYPCHVETRRLGGSQLAEKLTLDDGRRKEAVVVKHFAGYSPVRTWSMRIMSLFSIRYEGSPQKLFENALSMNEKFRKAGLNTLEVVLADPKDKIIVTKFSKGLDLTTIFQAALEGEAGAMRSVEKFGAALGTAHRNDLSVGDMNTNNVLFVDGEPCFIDLDQGAVGGKKGFDIVMPFYYALLKKQMGGKPEAWALVAGKFLQGYLAGGGGAGNIKDALDHKYTAYWAPLVLLKARDQIHAVRREMKKVAGGSLSEESDEELGLAR